jgi:hypothetical protein
LLRDEMFAPNETATTCWPRVYRQIQQLRELPSKAAHDC